MNKHKTLIIVRHGKSEWDYNELTDIDRPLAERGVGNSYKMAKRLFKKNITPDLLISSPAIRALHTAIIFSREMEIPLSKLKVNETLYFSSENEILSLVQDTRPEVT